MLDIAMRQVIRKLWMPNSYSLNTEDIYIWLETTGMIPLDDEMSEIIRSWKKQGLIRGCAFREAEAMKQHGAFTITWVSSRL